MKRRRPIPKAIETAVLLGSARRCCLCYGLNGDFHEKKGQIAHLDHNRSNHEDENLAFLCFDHHDAYDTRTSQSKGFTIDEMRFYRGTLYVDVKRQLPREYDRRKEQKDQIGDVIEKALSVDGSHVCTGCILNGYEIQTLVQEKLLCIDPYYLQNTGMVSHRLTLGDEAIIDGTLVSAADPFAIRPRVSVLVQTAEVVGLPDAGLLGRITPCSTLFRNGLTLDSGTTIHPGWQGRLVMLLFNTTNTVCTTTPGMSIAQIEFVRFRLPPRQWFSEIKLGTVTY